MKKPSDAASAEVRASWMENSWLRYCFALAVAAVGFVSGFLGCRAYLHYQEVPELRVKKLHVSGLAIYDRPARFREGFTFDAQSNRHDDRVITFADGATVSGDVEANFIAQGGQDE